MSRSILILASALAGFGFGLTAYAGEQDQRPAPMTRLPPLAEQRNAELRLESQRQDDLERDLGAADPRVAALDQSLAEAERDQDRLRTAATAADARIYRRALDEQMLAAEQRRRQAEGEPGGWR